MSKHSDTYTSFITDCVSQLLSSGPYGTYFKHNLARSKNTKMNKLFLSSSTVDQFLSKPLVITWPNITWLKGSQLGAQCP